MAELSEFAPFTLRDEDCRRAVTLRIYPRLSRRNLSRNLSRWRLLDSGVMRWLIIVALLASACGGSSTGPSAILASPAPIVAAIQITPCPTSGPLDLSLYREIACNGYENPSHLEPVRRWTIAPKLYLRTVDEAGTPIDLVTLDTVQNAMTAVASVWMNGHGLAGVERGGESREGVSGWITVKWPAPNPNDWYCGLTQVAIDGGTIELHYAGAFACGCNGSKMKPVTAKHELGHALGYWHTDGTGGDVMSPQSQAPCDGQPSARELQAAAYQYR